LQRKVSTPGVYKLHTSTSAFMETLMRNVTVAATQMACTWELEKTLPTLSVWYVKRTAKARRLS
jgi:hypothetical protein